MPSTSYYPLTLGNTWTYKTNAGQSYTTKMTEQNGDAFTVHTTLVNASTKIKRAGDEYISDNPRRARPSSVSRKT
ncbi:MAG: hypothetical protein HY867_05755 [Chloroflexi bacterium]|nr:hypothetical protein [Chloroflexota bacterium]